MNNKLKTLNRVLVANRGEIAVRIIRAARELGIESVAVYTDADAGTLAVRLADKAIYLGASPVASSYLNQERLIEAAIQSGADCLHPGYGFFAENADFAEAVAKEKITFIGPSPKVIRLMAGKDKARELATKAGVPVVPGMSVPSDVKKFKKEAASIGYPLMLKAVAGGSGRGMRLARTAEELESALTDAKKEALAAFGNDEMLMEKFIEHPRHIEIQVFADSLGNVVHLGERDCTVQRRHQKLVEEAPAAKLHPKLREQLHQTAVSLCKEVGYLGAGTIEYLVERSAEPDGSFYFLEMNTRIQVEHPVTEEVFGVDLVAEQFRVARGESLSFSQSELVPRGHSLEFRLYAEDPSAQFKPCTGTVVYVSRPGGRGVREDTWIEAGTKLSAYYDSLLSKLVVTGRTREDAIARAKKVLAEYVLEGMPSTLGFHRWLLEQDAFNDLEIDVTWLERSYQGQELHGEGVGPVSLAETKNWQDPRKSNDSET